MEESDGNCDGSKSNCNDDSNTDGSGDSGNDRSVNGDGDSNGEDGNDKNNTTAALVAVRMTTAVAATATAVRTDNNQLKGAT